MKTVSWGSLGAALSLALSIGAAAPSTAQPIETTYPLVTVSVDQAELQTQGILMNGRSLLPVRDLTERLNGKVMWDSHTKTLWAAFPEQGRTVRMIIDAPVAEIYEYAPNDPHRTGRMVESVRLDQPPVLLGGRVVAPVAAVAEVAGAKVFFEPETKHVLVQTVTADETASR